MDDNHPLGKTLALIVSLATIIGCVAAVFVVPEIRVVFGLDSSPSPVLAASPVVTDSHSIPPTMIETSEILASKLRIRNLCGYSFDIIVRYKGIDGQWYVNGWWTVEPNETATVGIEDIPLLISDPTIYYYARMSDYPEVAWEKGSGTAVEFLEKPYLMDRIEASVHADGSYIFSLNCSNYPNPTANNAYRIRIYNICKDDIQIALRYRNMEGDWVTGGWWLFTGGEISRISLDEEAVSTNHMLVYYFAEALNEPYEWSGDYSYELLGREIKMRKLLLEIDGKNELPITLTCDID